VVDAESLSVSVRDLGVVGVEGKAREILEPRVGGSKCLHAKKYTAFRGWSSPDVEALHLLVEALVFG
jgi:hypothetical protein